MLILSVGARLGPNRSESSRRRVKNARINHLTMFRGVSTFQVLLVLVSPAGWLAGCLSVCLSVCLNRAKVVEGVVGSD